MSQIHINARPLTPETCPQGLLTLISPTLTTAKTRIGNGGTSTRTADIAPCVNNYDLAPSGQPGRPVLSSSRNRTFPVKEQQDGRKSVDIRVLERHPYTTQSFIPMGGSAAEEKTYIVLVAHSNDDDTAPDLSSVQAFTVKGNEGVCYGAAVWHAPMCVVKQTTDFAIFQFSNGVTLDDCVLVDLAEPLRVFF